jgi:hypothetical protein
LGKSFGFNHNIYTARPFRVLEGLEPSKLLDYDSRLVAFTQELPFQEGKPLSPISEEGEGSTELLEYSHTADNSLDR